MESQYDTNGAEHQHQQEQTRHITQQLEHFLGPLLVRLDAYLDKRLVWTFLEAVVAIIRYRNRAEGLWLSELGAYLLDGKQAPAGTKRLGNLLRAAAFEKKILETYLWEKADERVRELQEKEEERIAVWDGSVIEKKESEKTEGLCAVKSSKAVRLRKQRKGVWNPPAGKPITVLGMEWIGILIVGMQGTPTVATMKWWSRKGENATKQRQEEKNLLREVSRKWGRNVVNVFDRGYAGGPWLELLCLWKQRFVIRWKKGHLFFDQQGKEKKLWEIARGKRSMGHRQIWDAKTKCSRKMGIVSMKVKHTKYSGWLWFIVVRTGGEPWYLITNEEAETEEQAWRIALMYARRWQIEMMFRYGKSELAMESPRMKKWENSEKLLLLVTLAYAYLLSLLDPLFDEARTWLLRHYCHRTGKRHRTAKIPLYRLRWALSRFWNEHRPIFSKTLFTEPDFSNQYSKSPG